MQEALHGIEKRLVLDADVLNVCLRAVDSVAELDNLTLELGNPGVRSVLQRHHGFGRRPWLRLWWFLSVNKIVARGAPLDFTQPDHVAPLEIALPVLELP